ncbi:hypothetical protein VNO78_38294 [Psophocarpus tetragonolobus]|uniref:Uncharacterized protein n=1 Tax=Psophocarpus tetragonolobus TaxID=3891 RepID=A0AAN9NAA0_PSOTE
MPLALWGVVGLLVVDSSERDGPLWLRWLGLVPVLPTFSRYCVGCAMIPFGPHSDPGGTEIFGRVPLCCINMCEASGGTRSDMFCWIQLHAVNISGWTLGWVDRSASGVHRLARPFCRRCAPGLNWPGRASGAVTLKKLECSKQAYALDTLAWDNTTGF